MIKLNEGLLKQEAKLNYDVDEALSKVNINKLLEYSYLNLQPKEFLDINNELVDRDKTIKYENPLFELMDFMRQPDNFAFTCKWLLGIDLLPLQVAILKELWYRKYPMFIGVRGAGKSFLLALYTVLLLLFRPGSKVIFVGAGFRQSKILFEYVESFYRNSPIFQNIIGNSRSQGPKHDTDRHSFYAGDSVAHALPIGDGQKIRGMRATTTISDEFHSMILEVFEVVIEGFASVNANPVEKVKRVSTNKILKQFGMDIDELKEELGNQTIISGTAFYAFNHFYDYWNRYKGIVNSRGNIRKLEEIFNGEVPSKFDWSDYSVIRLPWEVVPEGMMDETHIAKAKAIMHSSRYLMEYGACLLPNTDILVDTGCKKIVDIEIGDKVLTHTGQFKKVIKKTFRQYNGDIIKLKCFGYNQEIGITPNHKVWKDKEWIDVNEVCNTTNLSQPISLNGKMVIDITDYCEDYTILTSDNNYIYPTPSQKKIPNTTIDYILYSDKSTKELSSILNMTIGAINTIKRIHKKQQKYKSCIKRYINLGYDFGIIIGYYLSEGSTGANGRATNFALDGHVNCKCEFYIKQLCDSKIGRAHV
jgi:hypothetical protein